MAPNSRDLAYRPGPGVLVPADAFTLTTDNTQLPAARSILPSKSDRLFIGITAGLTVGLPVFGVLCLVASIATGTPIAGLIVFGLLLAMGLLFAHLNKRLRREGAWAQEQRRLAAACDYATQLELTELLREMAPPGTPVPAPTFQDWGSSGSTKPKPPKKPKTVKTTHTERKTKYMQRWEEETTEYHTFAESFENVAKVAATPSTERPAATPPPGVIPNATSAEDRQRNVDIISAHQRQVADLKAQVDHLAELEREDFKATLQEASGGYLADRLSWLLHQVGIIIEQGTVAEARGESSAQHRQQLEDLAEEITLEQQKHGRRYEW
jgi:hypothetical protein